MDSHASLSRTNQWNPADPHYDNNRMFGHVMIQSLGDSEIGPGVEPSYGITNDIELMGFDIVGQMLEHEGGVKSSIELGNVPGLRGFDSG